mmetsp:Transcript_48787/g.116098  ORF Transcript_48787/g.116098 Transcript_48787/m.116098 type:complete len:250 (+) Transcript_48787:423-1172(+)
MLVGSHALKPRGGGNLTCAVPSDSSSLSTIPSQPQASARRSSHFNAECASTAGFSSSSLATLTDLIGSSRSCIRSLSKPKPDDSAISRKRGLLCSISHSWSRVMPPPSGSAPSPKPAFSVLVLLLSSQLLNQSTRSVEPSCSSSGGPLPYCPISSFSSFAASDAGSATDSSDLQRLKRFSSACDSDRPACSAIAEYAFRNAGLSGASKGPGINSTCSPGTSPPPSRTIMQERLSFDPHLMASWQTAMAA